MKNRVLNAQASLQRNDEGETCVRLTLDTEFELLKEQYTFELDLDQADAMIFELFTAVDTWRGIVRPSKPLTRVDHVLRRFRLQRG
jgi:hypothetical protein